MNANLVLQEGPGAGRTYPLDPQRRPVLSVGRSSQCTIVLNDNRASRHHADIRWDGRQWSVADQGSTNGTYVNGMQVHNPYGLHSGDRITIGETTMVLRPAGAQAPVAASDAPASIQDYYPSESVAVSGGEGTGSKAVFWLVQGIIAAAIVFLASGAFLPWLRVTGSLSSDLGPLVEGLTGVISQILGGESQFQFTQEISGLEGYGKLTLAIAVISLLALVVDLFLSRKTTVPGIIYLLSSLLAAGAMASDLLNFYRLYEQATQWSLLFGIQLGDVISVFDKFVEMKVEPLPGLMLTVLGLGLLLLGGVGRLVVAILSNRR